MTGCTDETACNYDEDATTDDGSCFGPAPGFDCEGNCDGAVLTMSDSYGDGWNGAALTINGEDYTFASGSSATACVEVSGCVTMSWTSGTFDSETSWTLDTLASGSGGSTPSSVGDCSSGCSDSTAVNYNPDADLVDDSLCEYPATCDYAMSLSGSDSSNTGDMGWFSFEMVAAGSATVNVSAVTDFPEFIETTVIQIVMVLLLHLTL